MANKPKSPSDTARSLLTAAARRDGHLIPLPRLPVAAARQVIRSMLNAALVEEVPAPIDDPAYSWRTGEDGGVLMLRATRRTLTAEWRRLLCQPTNPRQTLRSMWRRPTAPTAKDWCRSAVSR